MDNILDQLTEANGKADDLGRSIDKVQEKADSPLQKFPFGLNLRKGLGGHGRQRRQEAILRQRASGLASPGYLDTSSYRIEQN